MSSNVKILFHIKKIVPSARNEKNPITSVTVVKKTVDATAGSILIFFKPSGIKTPAIPAAIKLIKIESPKHIPNKKFE